MSGDILCRPSFMTICKQGTTEPVWTVTTSCPPPGFEACGLQQPQCG